MEKYAPWGFTKARSVCQAMDKSLKSIMKKIQLKGATVTLPMPVFLVVEDVGWWEGVDGSAWQEPYRSNMARRHCLEDYQALVHLGERLSMRIGLGMVMCEWDRTNFLKNILKGPRIILSSVLKTRLVTDTPLITIDFLLQISTPISVFMNVRLPGDGSFTPGHNSSSAEEKGVQISSS